MPWVKIDDGIVDNLKTLKVWAQDPEAFALDVRGIAYCAKQLTDGLVPDEILALWYAGKDERLAELVDILVGAGRWERADGGYTIHDFLEYNKSRAEVEAERAKRARAGKEGGRASGKARRDTREAIDQSLADARGAEG
jgi:hypothetical protein